MNISNYQSRFPALSFEDLGEGILQLVLRQDKNLNAADASMHRDIAYVWQAIDADSDRNSLGNTPIHGARAAGWQRS